jgi:hypothetical protein
MSSSLWRRLQGWWRRLGITPGASGEPVVHDVTQTHDEVEHYWTDERMRAAQTREQKLPQPDEKG